MEISKSESRSIRRMIHDCREGWSVCSQCFLEVMGACIERCYCSFSTSACPSSVSNAVLCPVNCHLLYSLLHDVVHIENTDRRFSRWLKARVFRRRRKSLRNGSASFTEFKAVCEGKVLIEVSFSPDDELLSFCIPAILFGLRNVRLVSKHCSHGIAFDPNSLWFDSVEQECASPMAQMSFQQAQWKHNGDTAAKQLFDQQNPNRSRQSSD